MDAVEFLKAVNKICDTIEDCRECPLNDENLCITGVDDGKEEKAVSIVEQWSKEHPVMTNGAKFKEMFGFTFPVDSMTVSGIYINWVNAEYKEPKGEE